MRYLLCLALLFAFASACVLADDCGGVCEKPLITQTKQTSWTDGNGVQYSVWDGFITASSSSISSLYLTVGTSGSLIDQVWELGQLAGQPVFTLPAWRLQNGGIPAGQSHRFGYTIRSAEAAPFRVSGWGCPAGASPSSVPSPSPSSQPANPSASPSSQPSNPSPVASPQPGQTASAQCDAVLVIDNYIVRSLPSLSGEQIKAKYMPYFEDVSTYYAANFNLNINWTYVYVETSGSFTDTLESGALLDNFRDAIAARQFGNPVGACLYHLLTARQPAGVGGLGYIGSACGTGPAFSVDGQASEDPELVIRRAIHEIGHNLGGNHPDAYTADKGYTCSTNEDRAYDRILRDEAPSYNFLSPTAFISDCATQSIKASIPSYSCMWTLETTNSISPRAILCTEEAAEGTCLTIAAHYGTSQCYNVLPINDAASSFQVFNGPTTNAVGLQLYYDIDCTGSSTQVRELYSPTMPSGFNDQVTSFRFIVQ